MKYELMLMLDPSLTDKQLEERLGEIKGHIDEAGFKILDEDNWGKRSLAYKIKGHFQATYVVLLLDGSEATPPALKGELKIQPSLMRYLLMKMPEDYTLTRYDEDMPQVATRKLKSKHAEELAKKVTSKKKAKSEDKADEEPSEEDKKKLDEQLQAIADDADIEV